MKKSIIVLILLILVVYGRTSAQKNGNLGKTKITIKYSSSPSAYSVDKAPLKYDKLFAFSCQLDDGGLDIYTHGFPFLNGGNVSGIQYPGLSYTDGCGHDVKFKMSSSIFSMDAQETIDVHDPVTGWNFLIQWSQLNEIYQNGWGISNHGLTNQTGNYEYSVARNHSYVKLQTGQATPEGVRMGIFVNPNGDTLFSQYAFQQGYPVCFIQGYHFGYPSFDVKSNWNRTNIRMGRTNFYTGISIASLANNMAAASINGAHQWGVAFSHSVTDGAYGYDFSTFKSEMGNIESAFGKSGADNIWMTTEEEVLDYLLLSPYITIDTQKTGNDIVIGFNGDLPTNFRFYAISLLVKSDANIQSVNIEGPGTITFNGAGTKNSLINLTWDKAALLPDTIDPAVKDAETWVSKTEKARTQKNANIAVDYVNILPNGPTRDGFRSRLCAISGIKYPPYFCALSVEDGLPGSFDIFPNPAREELFIKAGIIIEKITMLNVIGETVLEQAVKSRDVQINVSSVRPGIYFLKIDAGGKTFLRKVLVNP